jgi:hypothetical protein
MDPTLRRWSLEDVAYFCSGKFDPIQSPPKTYSSIFCALDSLAAQALVKSGRAPRRQESVISSIARWQKTPREL